MKFRDEKLKDFRRHGNQKRNHRSAPRFDDGDYVIREGRNPKADRQQARQHIHRELASIK